MRYFTFRMLTFLSMTFIIASCKKHIVKPQDQLSLLPPTTQTGANTFGCLINGQAFVPKNLSILEGARLQCNYILTGGGHYFTVGCANENSDGSVTDVILYTDSLTVSQGQTLTLSDFNKQGMASGSYAIGSAANIPNYYTNNSHGGQLYISHLDSIKQIISGTFYFKAINSKGDTINVTNGRFDMQYTR